LHSVVVDIAMLVLANALFLLEGDGYGIGTLIAFDVIVVGLVAGSHGYARRLRLDALDDLRVTFTSTAVAAMTIIAIDALGSSEEPGVYSALACGCSRVLLAPDGSCRASSSRGSGRAREPPRRRSSSAPAASAA
jgi:hypothetical protein